jgi:hypothetical protein
MNKSLDQIELENGVVVEFYPLENRYFGDYHRLQIKVIATIPVDEATLPEELKNSAVRYSGSIKYEKTLERMGVATNQINSVAQSMVDDFIKTVGCYLKNKQFAENWLRKNMISQPYRNRFSLE